MSRNTDVVIENCLVTQYFLLYLMLGQYSSDIMFITVYKSDMSGILKHRFGQQFKKLLTHSLQILFPCFAQKTRGSCFYPIAHSEGQRVIYHPHTFQSLNGFTLSLHGCRGKTTSLSSMMSGSGCCAVSWRQTATLLLGTPNLRRQRCVSESHQARHLQHAWASWSFPVHISCWSLVFS